MRRRRSSSSSTKPQRVGNYFVEDKRESLELNFFSSGSTILDCVLGGGWPLGRMSNVVGDKSTGKTLLAIEATVNFLKKYSEGKIYYHEAESAFDKEYARALQMPVDEIEFTTDDMEDESNDGTIEFLYETLERIIPKHIDRPGLVVVDSYDSLSTRKEQSRKIDKDSYGTEKAALSSQLFRRLNTKLARANIHLMIISQVRDNIGVTFGKKHKRSGGKALDFYATQVLWLSDLGKIRKTVDKIDREIGVNIKAKCDKNKISLPYRQCELPILFGYGVDDVSACLNWLKEVGGLDRLDISVKRIARVSEQVKRDKDVKMMRTISRVVRERWQEIETTFIPKYSKY
jgi:recombination protein RecA